MEMVHKTRTLEPWTVQSEEVKAFDSNGPASPDVLLGQETCFINFPLARSDR